MLTMEYFAVIAIHVLAALGWSDVITMPGMVFGFIRKNNFPSWIRKPLYECAMCSSAWIAIITVLLVSFDIPVVVVDVWKSAVGIAAIIGGIHLIKSR